MQFKPMGSSSQHDPACALGVIGREPIPEIHGHSHVHLHVGLPSGRVELLFGPQDPPKDLEGIPLTVLRAVR